MTDEHPGEIKAVRTVKVMTYDVDFAGVVSNLVYHRWLEDLRMDLLSRFADLRELMGGGIIPILARTEVDFKRPLFLLDEVVCEMVVHTFDDRKWILDAQFLKDGNVCTKARQSGTWIDLRTKRPVPAPPSIPRIHPE